MTQNNSNVSLVKYQTIVQTISLLALVLGIAGMFVIVGRKDQMIESNSKDLSELRGISHDLVKSQVLGSATDSHHAAQLQDLKVRIERLESR